LFHLKKAAIGAGTSSALDFFTVPSLTFRTLYRFLSLRTIDGEACTSMKPQPRLRIRESQCVVLIKKILQPDPKAEFAAPCCKVADGRHLPSGL
jgi:hypothetical protein